MYDSMDVHDVWCSVGTINDSSLCYVVVKLLVFLIKVLKLLLVCGSLCLASILYILLTLYLLYYYGISMILIPMFNKNWHTLLCAIYLNGYPTYLHTLSFSLYLLLLNMFWMLITELLIATGLPSYYIYIVMPSLFLILFSY